MLVDSEPYSQRAWVGALAAHGATVSEQEVARFVGGTERDLAAHFAGMAGIDPGVLERTAKTLFLAAVAESGVPVYPDAVWLARSIPLPRAVASNSFRWRLDSVLSASGLAGWIGPSVAGDEVRSPKPAPDVYLEAIRRLGVEPEVVLVVEDSAPGIAAARSAGCRVVGVDRGTHEVRHGEQPDIWLDDLWLEHIDRPWVDAATER